MLKQRESRRNEIDSQVIQNTFFKEGATVFEDVFESVLQDHPEESFCFLNVEHLRQRVRLLQEHFIPDLPKHRAIAYAVKANPHEQVLSTLTEAGIRHFDCASIGEIETVQSIQPDAKIFFNHPIKRRKDIQEAVRRGVTHFTADSEDEVNKIIDHHPGKNALFDIALRMRTDNGDAKIALSEKFGADEAVIRDLIHMVRDMVHTNAAKRTKPGLSVHTGSQNTNPHVFINAIQHLGIIAKEERGIHTINIGGGLPANYEQTDNFDIRYYLDLISTAIRDEVMQALREEPTIIIEPGRGIIAEAIDLTIPILAVGKRDGVMVAHIGDGVFTSFSDSTVHGWKYPFEVLGKKHRKTSADLKSFTLFGRTCDSGDKITNVLLPEDLRPGDHLRVRSAGAYHDSQSTRFNGFEPPKYVVYNSI